jgi:hypothetical protein
MALEEGKKSITHVSECTRGRFEFITVAYMFVIPYNPALSAQGG